MDATHSTTAEGATGARPCQRCGAVGDGALHSCGDLRVCEACFIDLWRPHHRKPHWCYLGSIKGDYLRPGASG